MAAAPVLTRDDVDALPAPPPVDPPGRSRRSAVLVAILAVLLLAVAVPRVLDLVDGDVASGEPAAAAPSPPTTPTTVAPPATSGLEGVLPELVAFVEKERGLRFETPVKPVLLDDEVFRQRMVAAVEGDGDGPKTPVEQAEEDEARLAERALKALGLLRPDADILDDAAEFYGSAVLGVYDPESGELLVRGSQLSAGSKATLVHELTHALDDQHFELHRPTIGAEGTLEEADAFRALVEGSAERVEEAYIASLSASERAAIDAESARHAGELPSLAQDPIAVALAFPYFAGHEFVKGVLALSGQKALDAAFETPPTTTAEILAPARYLAGMSGALLTSPPGDGDAMMSGLFGADDLLALLAPTASQDALVTTLAAWEGDKVVAWTEGDKTCVRLRLLFSSAETTHIAAGVLAEWAASQPDASVEELATVVVTTCRVVPAQ